MTLLLAEGWENQWFLVCEGARGHILSSKFGNKKVFMNGSQWQLSCVKGN